MKNFTRVEEKVKVLRKVSSKSNFSSTFGKVRVSRKISASRIFVVASFKVFELELEKICDEEKLSSAKDLCREVSVK